MAARYEREHEWTTPPILSGRNRPPDVLTSCAGPYRASAQSTPTKDAWLSDACRRALRPWCLDRLNRPAKACWNCARESLFQQHFAVALLRAHREPRVKTVRTNAVELSVPLSLCARPAVRQFSRARVPAHAPIAQRLCTNAARDGCSVRGRSGRRGST